MLAKNETKYNLQEVRDINSGKRMDPRNAKVVPVIYFLLLLSPYVTASGEFQVSERKENPKKSSKKYLEIKRYLVGHAFEFAKILLPEHSISTSCKLFFRYSIVYT